MSSFRQLLSVTVALTSIELLTVAEPRLGMQWTDLMLWGISAHVLYGSFSCIVWFISRKVLGHKRASSFSLGVLIALHAGLIYRMDFAVNLYMSDPRLWGVCFILLVTALALGFWLSGWLVLCEKFLWAMGLLASMVLPIKGLEKSAVISSTLPDIVLISLDTTRPDALSVYGGGYPTPNIDALANRGVRFTEAISTAPLTEPAHLSMLTGQTTLQTGVASNGTFLENQPLFVTHSLRSMGYQTAAFVSGFPLHARYGWSNYFDVYDDDFGDWMGLHRLHIVQAWDQLVLPAHTLRERQGKTAVNRAMRWHQNHDGQPVFLFLHLFDPHAPYEAPNHPFDPPTDGAKLELPAYWPPPHREITDTQWLIDAYHAEVQYVDFLLGPFLDSLSEDSIIILTADHGESLTEHGYYFEHGDNLFDPSLRIPLVVAAPGLEAGVSKCLVSSMDIPSTIVRFLGRDDHPMRSGVALQDVISAESCPERIQLSTTVAARFVDQPPLSISARSDANKLIKLPESLRCYQFNNDPKEQNALSGSACPIRLLTAIEEAEQASEVKAPKLDAQTQDALEALGYIE